MGKKLFNDKEKWCPGCNAWLPLGSFHNCKSSASGKKSRCIKCFKKQNDPHVQKYLYGLTESELLTCWEGQERKCAICREPIPLDDRKASHVDRDRTTGAVRGLLCSRCTWGMSSFQENQVLLNMAIKYLQRFELDRREQRKHGIKPLCSSRVSLQQRTGKTSGPVR